jgi:hypothetical protein
VTIFQKNFSNWDVTTIPVDTEYEQCNFSQRVPVAGAQPTGVRLFPGDDTPRIFRNCNLINCEPPPGSTLVDCNTSISEYDVFSHADEIAVDSVVVSSEDKHNQVIHGRINQTTLEYEYETAPIVVPQDY